VFALQIEDLTGLFLDMEGKDLVFSQLRDEKLENGLALLVDVFKRLNN
jgi:hypothetical protein